METLIITVINKITPTFVFRMFRKCIVALKLKKKNCTPLANAETNNVKWVTNTDNTYPDMFLSVYTYFIYFHRAIDIITSLPKQIFIENLVYSPRNIILVKHLVIIAQYHVFECTLNIRDGSLYKLFARVGDKKLDLKNARIDHGFTRGETSSSTTVFQIHSPTKLDQQSMAHDDYCKTSVRFRMTLNWVNATFMFLNRVSSILVIRFDFTVVKVFAQN